MEFRLSFDMAVLIYPEISFHLNKIQHISKGDS